MTVSDTTRGALRREGEALPEAGVRLDLDEAVSRLLGSTEAAQPDPVHALIAEHRTAYAEWDRLSKAWVDLPVGTPEYESAKAAGDEPGDRELGALEALVTARPTTLAGLLTLTEYLPDALRQVESDPFVPDSERALRSVAETLRQFGRLGLPDRGLTEILQERRAKADEWLEAMQRDGFIPHPADRPRCLMAIDLAIPLEAKRLLAIAQDEFDRRVKAYASFPPAEREAHLARMRAEYRLDELAAVVRGHSTEAQPEPSLVDQIIACWRKWSLCSDGTEEEEIAANSVRLSERRLALIDAADALPSTPENLPAKALALAWVEYVSLWRMEQPREGYGIDGRLALDADAAICGRLYTGV